jgi:RNA recognition motif-containing protein
MEHQPLFTSGSTYCNLYHHGNPMKLLIRNLARTTTKAELRELFEGYGIVQSCDLVMDKNTGVSKGFGFVVMPSPGDAKAAMKNLNGTDVAGNRIRVKKAEPKPDVHDKGPNE